MSEPDAPTVIVLNPEPDSDPIEVDPASYNTDVDSAYASGSGSDAETLSLISEASDFVFENGRRFRSHRYPLPEDEEEQDRMDIQHHYMLLVLQGRLYTAPLENPKRILDIGTGTGLWALDMADEFPDAEIIGVDLSSIQPPWAPSNVSFEVDDIEQLWTWPENYFDYIHLRTMSFCIDDWPRLLEQAHTHLKPGGWIEVQDLTDFFACDDGTLPPDAPAVRWIQLLADAIARTGKPWWLDFDRMFKRLLPEHGFRNVSEIQMKNPLGPWAKDQKLKQIGRYSIHMKMLGIEAFTLVLFTRVLQWSLEDTQAFMEEIRTDIINPRHHAYERFFCICAQKPLTEE